MKHFLTYLLLLLTAIGSAEAQTPGASTFPGGQPVSFFSPNFEPPCAPSTTTGTITLALGTACANPVVSANGGSPDNWQFTLSGNGTLATSGPYKPGQVFAVKVTEGSSTPFTLSVPSGGWSVGGLCTGSGTPIGYCTATNQIPLSGIASGKNVFTCQIIDATPTIWCPSVSAGLTASAAALAFDPARILSGSALSNNNQTFSVTGASSINYSAFGTTFHNASGFYVFEYTYTSCSTVPGPGACEVGAADSSELDSNYLGQTTHSFGWRNDGTVYLNAVQLSASFPTWVSGNVLDVAVDLTNHLLCGRVNGGTWSPAAPGGACLSIAGMSSYNLSWAAKAFTNGDTGTVQASPTVAGTTPW